MQKKYMKESKESRIKGREMSMECLDMHPTLNINAYQFSLIKQHFKKTFLFFFLQIP